MRPACLLSKASCLTFLLTVHITALTLTMLLASTNLKMSLKSVVIVVIRIFPPHGVNEKIRSSFPCRKCNSSSGKQACISGIFESLSSRCFRILPSAPSILKSSRTSRFPWIQRTKCNSLRHVRFPALPAVIWTGHLRRSWPSTPWMCPGARRRPPFRRRQASAAPRPTCPPFPRPSGAFLFL